MTYLANTSILLPFDHFLLGCSFWSLLLGTKDVKGQIVAKGHRDKWAYPDLIDIRKSSTYLRM